MSEKGIEKYFNYFDKVVKRIYTSAHQDQIETERDLHQLYIGLSLPLGLFAFTFLLSVALHVFDGELTIELVPISIEALAVSFVAAGSISATGAQIRRSSSDTPDEYKSSRDMQRLVGYWLIAAGFIIQLFVISISTPFSEMRIIGIIFNTINIPLVESYPTSLLFSILLVCVLLSLTVYVEKRSNVWGDRTSTTQESEETEDPEKTTDNQRSITVTIEYQKEKSG